MRVLFFGTPEFAVPSLMALVGEGFDVVGVATRPDRPTGRHRSSATPSAVKLAALAEDLPRSHRLASLSSRSSGSRPMSAWSWLTGTSSRSGSSRCQSTAP